MISFLKRIFSKCFGKCLSTKHDSEDLERHEEEINRLKGSILVVPSDDASDNTCLLQVVTMDTSADSTNTHSLNPRIGRNHVDESLCLPSSGHEHTYDLSRINSPSRSWVEEEREILEELIKARTEADLKVLCIESITKSSEILHKNNNEISTSLHLNFSTITSSHMSQETEMDDTSSITDEERVIENGNVAVNGNLSRYALKDLVKYQTSNDVKQQATYPRRYIHVNDVPVHDSFGIATVQPVADVKRTEFTFDQDVITHTDNATVEHLMSNRQSTIPTYYAILEDESVGQLDDFSVLTDQGSYTEAVISKTLDGVQFPSIKDITARLFPQSQSPSTVEQRKVPQWKQNQNNLIRRDGLYNFLERPSAVACTSLQKRRTTTDEKSFYATLTNNNSLLSSSTSVTCPSSTTSSEGVQYGPSLSLLRLHNEGSMSHSKPAAMPCQEHFKMKSSPGNDSPVRSDSFMPIDDSVVMTEPRPFDESVADRQAVLSYTTWTIANPTFQTGIYIGPIVNDDIPHGKGRIKFPDGNHYFGPFKMGKMHGHDAIDTEPDGSVYMGEFRNNFRHGLGQYITTKRRYVGDFEYGRPHGKGTLYYLGGSIDFHGQWIFGQPFFDFFQTTDEIDSFVLDLFENCSTDEGNTDEGTNVGGSITEKARAEVEDDFPQLVDFWHDQIHQLSEHAERLQQEKSALIAEVESRNKSEAALIQVSLYA